MVRSGTVLLALAAAVFVASVAAPIYGALSSGVESAGNRFEAAPDLVPPTVEAAVLAKPEGGVPGRVGVSGRAYAYARVVDHGKPPSGVLAVTGLFGAAAADASLAAGSWQVGGQPYDRRSEELELETEALTAGVNELELRLADAAGNESTRDGFEFVYDPDPPRPTAVEISNGGEAGVPDEGDSIAYRFDEPLDPASVVGEWASGGVFLDEWDGSTRPVTVRFLAAVAYGSEDPETDPVRVSVHAGQGPEPGTPFNLGDLAIHADSWGVACEAVFTGSTAELRDGQRELVIALGEAGPGEILTEPPLSPGSCP